MDWFFEQLAVPFWGAILRLALLAVVASVVTLVVRVVFNRLEAILVRARDLTSSSPEAAVKRVSTLLGVVETIARVAIWAIAVAIGLDQIGLDIRPLLAGAGIAGIAVGFGAQNLVRDLISGFFILLEDQVRVGDVAVVNGIGGVVETITFRTIVLRDELGTVHTIPLGTVTALANMTKDWSAYVIELSVSYDVDVDRVVALMQRVDEEMRAHPDFEAAMLAPIEVYGVEAFRDAAVMLKARLKTQPIQQWRVGREYRRRLMKALDAEGIELPVPHPPLRVDGANQILQALLRVPPIQESGAEAGRDAAAPKALSGSAAGPARPAGGSSAASSPGRGPATAGGRSPGSPPGDPGGARSPRGPAPDPPR
jgi:small-conductance mechanosensitive channel